MLVFVGEITNPPGLPQKFDLTGRAGERLAELAGVSFAAFLRRRRFNLCRDEWRDAEAHERAAVILAGCRPGDCIVMLGTRVIEAFMVVVARRDHGYRPRLRRFEAIVPMGSGVKLIAFPHPSGRSRFWNDPANSREASRVLRQIWEAHA